MRPLLVATFAAAVLLSACTSSGDDDDSGTTSSGGGCNSHAECPGGFACKLHQCVTSCTSSTPLLGGCVVGSSCDNGSCVLNTACSESVDCAYDKGQVCQFSTGQCTASPENCVEGETGMVCTNGYTCHVKVCYVDCSGSKGCPAGKTCNNNRCQ